MATDMIAKDRKEFLMKLDFHGLEMLDRIKMVKAMEYVMRNLDDERLFDFWLSIGVADGDITYGDLDAIVNAKELEFYVEPDNCADLMATFIHIMKQCDVDGGLYCVNIESKRSSCQNY